MTRCRGWSSWLHPRFTHVPLDTCVLQAVNGTPVLPVRRFGLVKKEISSFFLIFFQEQLSALVRNLVRLRHLVMNTNLVSAEQLQQSEVPLQQLEPTDVYRYIYRFNRYNNFLLLCDAGVTRLQRLNISCCCW
jgi:hypothetical protein